MQSVILDGRLEFVLGLQTNQLSHFTMIYDQYKQQLNRLYNEFKIRPRVAWNQAKDLVVSEGEARMLAELGFDTLFLNSWTQDRAKNTNSSQASQVTQFIWRPQSSHFVEQKQLFTEIIEFDKRKQSRCFSFGFEGKEDENEFKTLIETIEHINLRSWKQKSNHLLLPFDCNFGINSIKETYSKMDAFIAFFNKYNYDNIVLEYSTTRNYVQAVHDEIPSWPVL